MVRSITLEEHFSSQALRNKITTTQGQDPFASFPPEVATRLAELDDVRLKDMDDNDIELQVISHAPVYNATHEDISASNDELAAAIKTHPTRYAGFAQLPMADPPAAAAELERCVKQLGFLGALVDNHTNGLFYDGEQHDIFWRTAQDLDVPIYLHPAWPSEDMARTLYSGGGLASRPLEATLIGGPAYGWHAECGVHLLRLLAARTFEKFPRLKIVLGHSGEMLPFMFDRIERFTGLWGLKRGFREVMHGNVWITTSGMFETHSLRCLMAVMPAERVLYSVDYPFALNGLGTGLLQAIEKEKLMNQEQLEAFAHGNARDMLFK